MIRTPLAFFLCLIAVGCAHAPGKPPGGPTEEVTPSKDGAPRELLAHVCGEDGPGVDIQKVTGSAWLKATSKEASGRFPAQILAEAPGKLVLEVMNLVGGTEAMIRVDGRRYLIDIPAQKNRKQQKQEGTHSWGGIPLQFATELFLGKIPCPPSIAFEDALFSLEKDELLVETQASLARESESFRYAFRSWEGRPWPRALHWRKKGTVPVSVEFEFDAPEDKTRSPRRWQAKSAMGEVNVRWREREVTR